WSLDAWIVQPQGDSLFPSKSRAVAQSYALDAAGVAVETSLGQAGMRLHSRVDALPEGTAGVCRMAIRALSDKPAWLAVSLRPYNPEGVSFVHDLRLENDRSGWIVDGCPAVRFSAPADRHFSSEYHVGDVFHKLLGPERRQDTGSQCRVGLATGAALFALEPGAEKNLELRVDLSGDKETPRQFPVRHPIRSWEPALAGLARLEVPDAHFMFLYEAAVRSLILHSPGEVFPGPYTYKRFWFRDAAFILNAM